jgi:hypothetical protein
VIDEMRENDSTLQIRISTCLRKTRSCTDYKFVNLIKLSKIKFKENPFSLRVVRPAYSDRQGERDLLCALLQLQFRSGQKRQPIFVHRPFPPLPSLLLLTTEHRAAKCDIIATSTTEGAHPTPHSFHNSY